MEIETESTVPQLLNEEQAHARVAHIWTLSQFKGLRNRKQGPKYARLAGKIMYTPEAIDEWLKAFIEKNMVDPTRKQRKSKPAEKIAKPVANGKSKGKSKPADDLA